MRRRCARVRSRHARDRAASAYRDGAACPCDLPERGHAFGLEAAHGVMRYLQERGIGLDVGVGRVPIVPGAILFDLAIGRPDVTPTAAMGYTAAASAASSPPAQGNAGAGMGATVGKYAGAGTGHEGRLRHRFRQAAQRACHRSGGCRERGGRDPASGPWRDGGGSAGRRARQLPRAASLSSRLGQSFCRGEAGHQYDDRPSPATPI